MWRFTDGLGQSREWDLYHRVLSRAKWSAFQCSRMLLNKLIHTLCRSTKTLVFGIDETLERCWGPKIKARGIYHDARRSTKKRYVQCSGLRWICVMLLSQIGWTNQIWALPFLTVLAPSRRYYEQRRAHKKLGDWARQIALVLRRWLPGFELILVADGSYAIMELLAHTREHVTWITCFRWNASLYNFVEPRAKGMGSPPLKGNRQPSLKQRLNNPKIPWQKVCFSQWYGQINKTMEICSGTEVWYRAAKPIVPIKWVMVRDPEGKHDPIVIQSTDLDMEPVQIVCHFVKRWRVEVTFEEVRTHLGVETQRQWADLSIAGTTPVLMALFTIITLWADQLFTMQQLTIFQTGWYRKPYPTFSDAVASVRYRIWQFQFILHSGLGPNCKKRKTDLINHLAFMAARAA